MDAPNPAAHREFFLVEEVGGVRPQARAETRAKLVLTLSMWGASIALFTLGTILQRSHMAFEAALLRIAMSAIGVAICYGMHRLLRRLSHRSFRTRAIAVSAIAPFAAEAYAWANYFAFAALYGRTARFVVVDWNDAMYVLSMWTWFFIAWTGLYLAIEYNFDARHEAERAAELRTMAHTAKLRALSNQINPHFLFNSLNSISALILDGRGAEAERMLARLSTFFRSTLAIDPLVDVPLEQEFELHRRYLAIEQMRYPDLAVEIDLPDNLRKAAVPALIIQPLVENAIKHGVAVSRPPTRVTLTAERIGEQLSILVVDSGNADAMRRSPKGEGIGTANVRQRLAEYFGDAQSLTLTPGQGWFEARVTMPLAFAP
ncbi:hypothetical protein FHS95_003183 [Sphingomonas naasensis]|uniref:Signal transduction histidine kinase internal region domain-containing protein n=1 Tax=Sphingomonas naasensis TaxID=1344951 RepID=A0A4S1WH26_9SPHN|nr:histidine kinase [Sphingomonas naasensis]NIJ21480.1 hypothetical protein [Sphingomonas naasensis]TGX41565.1 hypothetical protein E5A74_13195 [Sphingomonas naasensis]